MFLDLQSLSSKLNQQPVQSDRPAKDAKEWAHELNSPSLVKGYVS